MDRPTNEDNQWTLRNKLTFDNKNKLNNTSQHNNVLLMCIIQFVFIAL